MSNRIETLDFAKGFALFFMVVQHLSIWLGGGVGAKNMGFVADNPIYFTAISFAALSAPIFVFSAGSGARYFMEKYGDRLKLVRRGIALILFGYILNFAVPSWFSPASWYVLHMIGFGLVVVSLISTLKQRGLICVFILIFIAAMTAQHILKTPMHISNRWMANMNLPMPFLRFAFVEGHFPVLPWLAFFVFGYASAEYIAAGKYKRLFVYGAVLWLAGVLFVILPHVFPGAEKIPFLERFYTVKLRFYPMLGPAFFLLTGSLPFLMYIFSVLGRRSRYLSPVFVPLGKISLTVFITHLFIKQFVHSTGIAESFDKWTTIGITAAVLSGYILLEKLWRNSGYRYGFEWILRKVG